MILDTLADYSKKRYKKFLMISFLVLLFIVVMVYLGLAIVTGLILSIIVSIVVLGLGIYFYFSFRKMVKYHSKMIEIWDEKIDEASK